MSRNLEALREALGRTLTDGDRITGIKAFSTGHSNETYLIKGLDQILRLPASADPLMPDCYGVTLQAQIYEALEREQDAPPVPSILFKCNDTSVLGDPFFVMARVAGEEVNDYEPQPWFADAPDIARSTMCDKWITSIAQLATLDQLAVLGAPVSPEDEARRWRGYAREANCPALVTRFDQLLSRPAPRTGTPSPVHGDPKLANLMWDKGELTAVLDWELAYNGEPLADLGYMLCFFESDARSANKACGYRGMWNRDTIISHWTACTGRSTAGARWHETAAIGKMAAIIAYGYNLYTSGKSDDARFERWKAQIEVNLSIMDIMLRSL